MTAIPDNWHLLHSAADIAQRVAQMGAQIRRDYAGKPLTLLVVLKGSFIFAADLCRAIDLPMHIEFMALRSYGDETTTSGVVQITLDMRFPVENTHVLIVEDIVDTGLTLDYLRQNLTLRRPASLRLVSLLHKPSRTVRPVTIDYLGFEVPDHFIIGYGLDNAGQCRNLPDIGYIAP